MAIYHFSRTQVSKTQVPHQFCHRGTAEVEIGQLKNIMWYSSMVNSSTMQQNTRVHQARVPFYNKMFFFLQYSSFSELEYLVNFFFFGDYQKININIKWFFFFYSFKLGELEYLVNLFYFIFLGLSKNKHKHKSK